MTSETTTTFPSENATTDTAGRAEASLQQLLAQNPSDVRRKLRDQFSETAGDSTKLIILFGVKSWPARHALEGLKRLGLEPQAFIDNDSSLWNTKVDGIPVLSPKEAADAYGKNGVFVVSIYNGSAPRKQLRELGCAKVLQFEKLFHSYADTFLPYLALDLPDQIFEEADAVRAALPIWADDQSQREYLAQLNYSITLDADSLPPRSNPAETYFPPDIVMPLPSDTFVDCGAFEGDTVEEYIKRMNGDFAGIAAFEPDPRNFQKSQAFVATLPTSLQQRIVLRNGAIGAKTQDVRFDFTGSAASTVLASSDQEQTEGAPPKTMPFTASEGVIDVKSFALDDVLAPGSQYYIKMDIEGAEYDTLLGAHRLLREQKSVWAVCLYHRLSDLWRIPLLFAKIGGYRLYLRRYAEGFVETVFYALPSDRMNS